MDNRFREIIYFSPEGKGMPYGVSFQRGNFLHECQKNKDAFDISQSVPSKKKGNQNGGIIVFSNNVETDSIGSVPQCYNVSKAFRGQYKSQRKAIQQRLVDDRGLWADIEGTFRVCLTLIKVIASCWCCS